MTRPVQRILITLAPDRSVRLQMRTAIKLAHQLETELCGIFIEDMNLINLSALPIARETVYGEFTRRNFNTEDIERAFHRQAQQLEQEFNLVAGESNIKCNFQIHRGHVDEYLHTLQTQTDMLILNNYDQITGGQTTYSLHTNSRRSHLSQVTASASPVVLYTGTAASQQALSIAIALTQGETINQVTILIPASQQIDREELARQTQGTGLRFNTVTLPELTYSAIAEVLHDGEDIVLFLPAEQSEQLHDKGKSPRHFRPSLVYIKE